ncbi:hypothetical protein [Methylobacterium sp. A54F]
MPGSAPAMVEFTLDPQAFRPAQGGGVPVSTQRRLWIRDACTRAGLRLVPLIESANPAAELPELVGPAEVWCEANNAIRFRQWPSDDPDDD